MLFRTILLISVLCVSSCFGPKSYRCNFLPETPPPDWVVSGSPAIDGFYVGTGSSGKNVQGPTGQLAEAKKRAIEDLASSIQVFVKNEVNTYKSNHEEKKNLTENISQHIVNMSLGNIQQDGRWLNRDACIVYVRVRLNREIADNMLKKHMENLTKFNKSQSLYILAKNDQLKLEERLLHLEEANKILKEIDFNALSRSKITQMRYPFFFNRNTRMIEEIQNDQKGYIEHVKLKTALKFYNRSRLRNKRRTTKIRNINRAIFYLSTVDFEVLNNSNYMENEKKYYLNKFYGRRAYLKDEIRYYINIGMNEKEVIKKIGKPIEKTKTYYLPLFERGHKYKKYWIIYKNGLVNCIVTHRGFSLNPGGLCRPCNWHRKYKRRYVVK